MESLLFLADLLRGHEPARSMGRFMESGLFLFELLSGHEPARVGGAAWPSLAA
jgi:hypothetical protein